MGEAAVANWKKVVIAIAVNAKILVILFMILNIDSKNKLNMHLRRLEFSDGCMLKNIFFSIILKAHFKPNEA